MRVHVTHNLHPAPHIDQAFGHVGDGQKIIAEAGYVSRTTQQTVEVALSTFTCGLLHEER